MSGGWSARRNRSEKGSEDEKARFPISSSSYAVLDGGSGRGEGGLRWGGRTASFRRTWWLIFWALTIDDPKVNSLEKLNKLSFIMRAT